MSELLEYGTRSQAETIPTTPVETLAMLAADGKFVSASLELPHDWMAADWKFTNDGADYDALSLVEVYAPGDESGWAIAYVPQPNGDCTGQTTLIRGNWTIERLGHDFSRIDTVEPRQEASEAPVG